MIETTTFGEEVPFIFVRLSVLREYLEKELTMPGLPFKYDFERVIDDWVKNSSVFNFKKKFI